MKGLKIFLKYKYVLLVIVILTVFLKFNISYIRYDLQTYLYQGLKIVKVTEENIKIKKGSLVRKHFLLLRFLFPV